MPDGAILLVVTNTKKHQEEYDRIKKDCIAEYAERRAVAEEAAKSRARVEKQKAAAKAKEETAAETKKEGHG